MFDWLTKLFVKKKEQEEEIKIDRTVHDLAVGYILDYDLESWEYVDAANSKFIYVSKWEDGSVECFTGDYLKEFHISNILAST